MLETEGLDDERSRLTEMIGSRPQPGDAENPQAGPPTWGPRPGIARLAGWCRSPAAGGGPCRTPAHRHGQRHVASSAG
jgi:hypothetical protein